MAKYLRQFGVDENNFAIKLSIVRGLDYYTGTVYETFIKGYENFGSVCSGGRFENLAGNYTKEVLPGVGMSIGLTRFFAFLKENNLIANFNKSLTKAILLPMENRFVENAILLSNKLRDNDINCTLYLEDKKFKTKLQYAIKSNIKYAIFIGEDEVLGNVYTIKNLETTEQKQMPADELIDFLNEN